MILGAIIRFQSEHDGIMWSIGMLAEVLNMSVKRVKASCNWLIRNEYAGKAHGEYFITTIGREYYGGCCVSPAINASPAVLKFKDEALSGLVTRRSSNTGQSITKQSTVDRAAIPSCGKHFQDDRTAEVILIEIEERNHQRRQIAGRLKITLDMLDELHADGKVQVCQECGKIGIFRITDGKLGAMCLACEKQR